MVKQRLVDILIVKVNVTERCIEEGKCGDWNHCMEKLAIEAFLHLLDPSGGNHRVKVDAGICTFNYKKFKWRCVLPKKPRDYLRLFDKERRPRARAEKLGLHFISQVRPHQYKMEAQKMHAIVPFTVERQLQVNEARRRRIANGKPDKKYNFRSRVEGIGNIS